MNVALYFVDMLRYDSDNWSVKRSEYFNEYQGQLSTKNAFSEAPDTPRSMSMLFSGVGNQLSGVDSRYKWPRWYAKQGCEKFFKTISDAGYNIKICSREERIEVGLFDNNTVNVFISNTGQNKKFNKNFYFFDITDFHDAVDATKGTRYCWDYVDGIYKYIADNNVRYNVDSFFIISDHGCVLRNEALDYSCPSSYDVRHKIIFEYYSVQGVRNENTNLISMETLGNLIPSFLGGDDISVSTLDKMLSKSANEYILVEDYSAKSTSYYPDLFRYKDNKRDLDFIFSKDVLYDFDSRHDLNSNIKSKSSRAYDIYLYVKTHKAKYQNLKRTPVLKVTRFVAFKVFLNVQYWRLVSYIREALF